jgi:hypothetical protein
MGIVKVVRTSKTNEYIRELWSKWIGSCLSQNKRPRENAPRMFEMADPMIFPIARDARLRERDAIMTMSCHRPS